MNYKIQLQNRSELKFVCGLAIPAGYFHVLDLNFKNMRQFENLKKAKGLAEVSIEETELPAGGYTQDGRKVDYESLKAWCFSDGRIQVQYEAPEVKVRAPEPEQPKVDDRMEMLKAELDEKGIKYRKNATVSTLEKLANV